MSDMRTASRPRGGRDVDVWGREQFLEYFGRSYAPGQHVTLIGPTQRGKTYISHQMLGQVASPQLPAVILAGKPPGRDHTMEEAPGKLGLLEVETWPPPLTTHARRWWAGNVRNQPVPNGYILKPHQSLEDLDADENNMRDQFNRAMKSTYAGKHGKVIVVADETKLLYDLGLKKRHEAILTRGAPMVGMWSLLQRGRNFSLYTYDMPEHTLFFQDPDGVNVKRYAEMVGGLDPALLVAVMNSLRTRESANRMTNSEAVYFRRSGSQLAIVGLD